MQYRAHWFLIGVLIVAFAGFATVRAGGACISTVMPEAAGLPDGVSLSAGDTLTLCTMQAFTPVSTLHAAYINGMPVRQLLSRRGESEDQPAGPLRPFMIFESHEDGRLQLHGFATPSRDRLVTYTFENAPRTRAQRQAAAAARARGSALAGVVHAVVLSAKAH